VILVPPVRRYVVTSDFTDSWGGHGTHVAGSIAGAVYDGWAQPSCSLAGTVESCWGECMTDGMCRNSYVSSRAHVLAPSQ
jgi:hypothetical protein